MSGLLIATLAGLLIQAAPHPSTQTPYEAPAIRPVEPELDLASLADDGAPPRRGPLTGPVVVDAYAGAYEAAPTGTQAAYARAILSTQLRADQTAGPLNGFWRVRDESGATLFDLVLIDPGAGPVEGGWRNPRDHGGAVFENDVLTLEGLGAIRLERDGDGWRGRLSHDGEAEMVRLSRD